MAKKTTPETHDVKLTHLSYSPVAAKREDDDYWAETFEASELEPVVVTRFENYVRRAVINQREEFYEVEFENSNGKQLKKRLDQALKLKPKDKTTRTETIQLLTNDLSSLMDEVTNPLPGALFMVETLVDDEPTVTLVKLDLEQREVVALLKERRHALKREFFERALSEDAKTMRKALLFPSPGDGDARTVQYDSESDYWRKFAGARPLREAKRAFTGLISAAKGLAQESNKTMDEKQAVDFMDKVQAMKEATPEKVAEALKTSLKLPQSPSNIADRVKRELKDARLVEVARLKSVKFTFRSQMSLTVPADLIRQKIVTVAEDKGDVVIRIKDTSVERTEQHETG